MKRRRILLALGVVLLACIILVVLLPGSPPSYSDADAPIEVKRGEEFVIRLESNRTTGYEWTLAEPVDAGILKLVGSEYRSSAGGAFMVGAGGNERWTFQAVGVGETRVTLHYVRPWERDRRPGRTAVFTVVSR